MATPTPAPDTQDALASLEARIAKAVEVVSELRTEREIIMKDLESAIAAKAAADQEVARLKQENDTLRAEHGAVKDRIQKVLGQLDQLNSPS